MFIHQRHSMALLSRNHGETRLHWKKTTRISSVEISPWDKLGFSSHVRKLAVFRIWNRRLCRWFFIYSTIAGSSMSKNFGASEAKPAHRWMMVDYFDILSTHLFLGSGNVNKWFVLCTIHLHILHVYVYIYIHTSIARIDKPVLQ